MDFVYLIDKATGDFIVQREDKTLVHKADEILCYGSSDSRGLSVVTKAQVPKWERIVNPTLVYSSANLLVVNPESGFSVIIHNRRMVQVNKWRITKVIETDDQRYMFGDSELVLIMDELGMLSVREHHIPDIENTVIDYPNDYGSSYATFNNGEMTNYFAYLDPSCTEGMQSTPSIKAWDCRCKNPTFGCDCDWSWEPYLRKPVYHYRVENEMVEAKGLIIYITYNKYGVIIDPDTKNVFQYDNIRCLINRINYSIGFAFFPGTFKLYLLGNKINIVRSRPGCKYRDDDDQYLPVWVPNQTKSARTGSCI